MKVGDDITVGEPLCDFGRGPEECIEERPFAPMFSPHCSEPDQRHSFSTWQDYCDKEFDIQLATSTYAGKT